MVDATDATFEEEILARSEQVPVVVDLWAEWCGPCQTLGPIIEKVVAETDGKAVLVKVDIDSNPALAEAFAVQSIPAVHAVRDRKVVASFIGARPEAEVRAFVQSLLPTEQETRIAELIEAGDEASLEAVLAEVPDHPSAIVALAEIRVGAGRSEDALALLAKVPETADTRRVAALARTGAPEAVEEKLDALLGRVKADDAARQEFLDLLELMGPDDPRTAEYRKALSRQLF